MVLHMHYNQVFSRNFVNPEVGYRIPQQMLDDLKEGDNVVTLSGIHGTVKKLKDDIVVLQIDNNVRIKINRASIGINRETSKN